MRHADLTDLVRRAHASRGQEMAREECSDIAMTVLSFFGYGDNCIANSLSPEDTQLFYMLEDLSILKPETREESLWNGRDWRITSWTYNFFGIQKIRDFIQDEIPEEALIYASIPDELYSRSASTRNPEIVHAYMARPAHHKKIKKEEVKKMEIREEKKEFPCRECKEVFGSKGDMASHYKASHKFDIGVLKDLVNEGRTLTEISGIMNRHVNTIKWHIQKIEKEKAIGGNGNGGKESKDLRIDNGKGGDSGDPDPQKDARNPSFVADISPVKSVDFSRISDVLSSLRIDLDNLEESIESLDNRMKDLEKTIPPKEDGGKRLLEMYSSIFAGPYDSQKAAMQNVVRDYLLIAAKDKKGARLVVIQKSDHLAIEIEIREMKE